MFLSTQKRYRCQFTITLTWDWYLGTMTRNKKKAPRLWGKTCVIYYSTYGTPPQRWRDVTRLYHITRCLPFITLHIYFCGTICRMDINLRCDCFELLSCPIRQFLGRESQGRSFTTAEIVGATGVPPRQIQRCLKTLTVYDYLCRDGEHWYLDYWR